MPPSRLLSSLSFLLSALNDNRRLAADAYSWASIGPGGSGLRISERQRDSMIELAFLRAFLAWEVFLEETFVLYLMGYKPPQGRSPRRYTFPPDLQVAGKWLIPEGRTFATWTSCSTVCNRAERFFQKGWPYADVLRSKTYNFDESNCIRNAIAHMSGDARLKFEKLIRDKLGSLPSSKTVGSFLYGTVPNSSPPQSFLEYYLGIIEFAARSIVPTK